MLILETEALQKATNHPVHHINKDGEFSPTALIPFCEFGGKMSIMGVQIDKFDVPVQIQPTLIVVSGILHPHLGTQVQEEFLNKVLLRQCHSRSPLEQRREDMK